ncbi:MAG: hypothetical protein KAU26_07765 [Methylococcales bacterium]|nr:hypothetical protein [Methylococcales bacterium]
MINLFITIGLIFLLMGGWIAVQQMARIYAAKHPELGAVKEEGLGCGKNCGCKENRCQQNTP